MRCFKGVNRNCKLPQIRSTSQPARRLARRLNSGQEKSQNDRDYCSPYKHFEQRNA